MTPQELFDDTAAHLRRQARPSIVGDQCRYRGPDGTRCAAGHHIADTVYDVGMEGLGVDSHTVRRGLGHLSPTEIGLLGDLQRVHDAAALPDGVPSAPSARRMYEAMGDERDFMGRVELGLREVARWRTLAYQPPGAP